MKSRILVLAGLLAASTQALAQDPAAIRGNWIADVDGVRHIYLLIVRDGAVTGTYCTDCNNPLNLAFVVDGTLEAGGVSFTVFHDPGTGATYLDRVVGRLVNDELRIEKRRLSSSAPATSMTLHRPPPPAPGDIPPPPVRPPYNPPGPPEALTLEKVTGLWIAGTGPGKQYFMIRRVGDELLGMVCGPCFRPVNMAPLDSFVLDGDQLHFNIVHEDTTGFDREGPWVNAVRAVMARNELHLFVVPSFADPETFTPLNMTLVGPVDYDPDAD